MNGPFLERARERAVACRLVRDELALFVGDDLFADGGDEIEQAAAARRDLVVREHLRDCVSCRAEASALLRSRKALQRFGLAAPDGVDATFFAELHGEIVRAARSPAPRARRLPWLAAAAVALFAFGFWLVAEHGVNVLERAPVVFDATAAEGAGLSRAVPYAGARVELSLLGYEDAGAVGQGMAGRLSLRALGDEARLPTRSGPPAESPAEKPVQSPAESPAPPNEDAGKPARR